MALMSKIEIYNKYFREFKSMLTMTFLLLTPNYITTKRIPQLTKT